jgi:methylmalonyl-CoA mutase N-terminal domain/subunit
VTVNLNRSEPDVPNTAFKIDPAIEARQIESVRKVRASRNEAEVANALEAVRAACRGGANMVPSVLVAVRAYATIGEICQIWREEFGIFEPSTVF